MITLITVVFIVDKTSFNSVKEIVLQIIIPYFLCISSFVKNTQK